MRIFFALPAGDRQEHHYYSTECRKMQWGIGADAVRQMCGRDRTNKQEKASTFVVKQELSRQLFLNCMYISIQLLSKF